MSDKDCERSAYSGGRTVNNIDRHVGGRIRELRCDFEVPTEILARELGVSREDLASMEDGSLRAGAQVLGRAAKALGVDISYFFEGLEVRDAPAGLRDANAGAVSNVIFLRGRKKL